MKRFLAVALVLTLTACGSRPAPDLYVLRAENTMPLPGCVASGGMVVERPTTRTEFDSKRIAILLDANHLTYYTGAAWASPFPDQLRSFFADRFAPAASDEAHRNATRLVMTVHEAHITNVGAPVIHLRLSGSLRSGNRLLAKFTADETIQAAANHMPEIAAAFNQAAEQAAQKIAKAAKRCKS